MPPVARVVLLVVGDDGAGGGHRIGPAQEPLHVRNPLLLVHDQIFHDVDVLGLCLEAEARGIIPVMAAVIHVHVQVAAPPAERRKVHQAEQRQTLHPGRRRRDAHPADHPAELHALGQLDGVFTGGKIEVRRAVRVKIGRFEAALLAVEGLIGVAPGIAGRPSAAVGSRHADPCAAGSPPGIGDREAKAAGRIPVTTSPRHHGLERSARHRKQLKRGVAARVADERDALSVGRPARRRLVAVAVGELKRVAAGCGRQPEIVALAPEVGAVDHSPAVAGHVGTRLPGGFLVADLPHGAAGAGFQAPDTSASPDLSPVRDQHERRAVGRPGGREVVIEGVVVVPGQTGGGVGADAHRRIHRSAIADAQQKDMPAALVRGGYEGDPASVGGPPRIEMHRPVLDQRPGLAGRELQHAQLERIVTIRGIRNESTVGRPVGLVVVPGAIRELEGLRAADPLPPERALHRVHQLLPVGRPGRRGRAAGNLREVHLPVVVVVWDADLLEDGLALGVAGGRQEERHE